MAVVFKKAVLSRENIIYPLYLILSSEKSRLVKPSTSSFLDKALLRHKGLQR